MACCIKKLYVTYIVYLIKACNFNLKYPLCDDYLKKYKENLYITVCNVTSSWK
jgi:hypothetical protein